MGKIIILVRHGESEANAKGESQGNQNKWSDTNLTKKGQIQAIKVSERLKKEKIDLIYSSDLRRAKQTAETINLYHNVEIKFEIRLREMRNDENLEDFIERVKSIFDKTKKEKGAIVIVAHGGVNLTILALTTKNREEGNKLVAKYRDEIRNTSICILEEENKKYIIKKICCHEHLKN